MKYSIFAAAALALTVFSGCDTQPQDVMQKAAIAVQNNDVKALKKQLDHIVKKEYGNQDFMDAIRAKLDGKEPVVGWQRETQRRLTPIGSERVIQFTITDKSSNEHLLDAYVWCATQHDFGVVVARPGDLIGFEQCDIAHIDIAK